MAILSTPSEDIKIFPSILQGWVDKRWGHIYRRGYTLQRIKELVEDVQDEVTLNIIYWNCPLFRFLYLSLSVLWRITPMLTKKVLNFIVSIESRFKEGENGFLYIMIDKEELTMQVLFLNNKNINFGGKNCRCGMIADEHLEIINEAIAND